MPRETMGRFIRTALASLLSASAAVAIVGWLSEAAVERYADAALERHSESFKHELNRQLTAFSGAVETAEAADRLQFDRMLSHRQQQLSEFYWPIYIRLQSDNAVWERVLGSDNPKRLPPDVRRPMEEFILQNHGEILKIVQAKYHLADHVSPRRRLNCRSPTSRSIAGPSMANLSRPSPST